MTEEQLMDSTETTNMDRALLASRHQDTGPHANSGTNANPGTYSAP